MEVRVNIAGIGRNWQPWVSARFLIWTIRKPGRQWQEMVENGRQWQRIDFRVFLVVVIEVTRKTMAENGLKWQKKGCRGKMAGNGFPRVSRRGHRGRKKEVR